MNILACYDGTKTGRAAVQLAEQHAISLNGSLLIIHIVDLRRLNSFQKTNRNREGFEGHIRKLLQPDGCRTDIHFQIGLDAHGKELVEFVKQNSIDEMVIGIGKKSKLGKIFSRATAQYVIQNAPCPVVTVK